MPKGELVKFPERKMSIQCVHCEGILFYVHLNDHGKDMKSLKSFECAECGFTYEIKMKTMEVNDAKDTTESKTV